MLKRIDGEQRNVLECHAVVTLQEDAQLGMLVGLGRGQHDAVFLPVASGDAELLLYELLTLVHRALINELNAQGSDTLRSLGPYGEAVLLALLDTDAEVALVDQSCATVVMPGCREHDIVRTALEGTVVLHLDASEGLPAHQRLGELERAVLDQFAIQTAIGSVVDILEEDTIHR